MTMDKMKCPYCGSEDIVCMDGSGTVSRYGKNVMIDIAPEIWLCSECKKSFRVDEFGISDADVETMNRRE